jgi:quinol monooxygenase YgiN
MSQPYTLATYRVIPSEGDEFIKAWDGLAITFSALAHPPHWGALIRSTIDPTLFHSFGPWESAQHIAAMRNSPEATASFKAIRNLCVEMLAGDYELVAHVRVREGKA